MLHSSYNMPTLTLLALPGLSGPSASDKSGQNERPENTSPRTLTCHDFRSSLPRSKLAYSCGPLPKYQGLMTTAGILRLPFVAPLPRPPLVPTPQE